jgi:hypothetical protein
MIGQKIITESILKRKEIVIDIRRVKRVDPQDWSNSGGRFLSPDILIVFSRE